MTANQVGAIANRDGIGTISEAACKIVAETTDDPDDVLATIRDLAREGKLKVTKAGEFIAVEAPDDRLPA